MDARQLELLLESMQGAVNDHFGVQLRLLPAQVVPISSLFETIPATRRLDASKNIYDFKSGRGQVRACMPGLASSFCKMAAAFVLA